MKLDLALIKKISLDASSTYFSLNEVMFLLPCIEILLILQKNHVILNLLNSRFYDQVNNGKYSYTSKLLYLAICLQHLSWDKKELSNSYAIQLKTLLYSVDRGVRLEIIEALFADYKQWHYSIHEKMIHRNDLSFFEDEELYCLWLSNLYPHDEEYVFSTIVPKTRVDINLIKLWKDKNFEHFKRLILSYDPRNKEAHSELINLADLFLCNLVYQENDQTSIVELIKILLSAEIKIPSYLLSQQSAEFIAQLNLTTAELKFIDLNDCVLRQNIGLIRWLLINNSYPQDSIATALKTAYQTRQFTTAQLLSEYINFQSDDLSLIQTINSARAVATAWGMSENDYLYAKLNQPIDWNNNIQLFETLFQYAKRMANKSNDFNVYFKAEIYNELYEIILIDICIYQFINTLEAAGNMELTLSNKDYKSLLLSMLIDGIKQSNQYATSAAVLFDSLTEFYNHLQKFLLPSENAIPFMRAIPIIPPDPFWDRAAWKKLFLNRGNTILPYIYRASSIDSELSNGLPYPISIKRRELEAHYSETHVDTEKTIPESWYQKAEQKANWYEALAQSIPPDKRRDGFLRDKTREALLAKRLEKRNESLLNKAILKNKNIVNNQLALWLKKYGINPEELKKRDLSNLSSSELNTTLAKSMYPDLYEKYPYYIEMCIKGRIAPGDVYDGISFWEKYKDKETLLPKVYIKGKDRLDKYYLCKVTNKSLRCLTLGLETDCCQYFGGEGREYARMGMALPNCGFYAIMKRSGEVDNQETDEVMVQSFAWLGKNGLVLDSMESKRPNEIERFMPLYEDFFKQILNYEYSYEHNDYRIEQITIGCGGSTPKDFNFKQLTKTECIPFLNEAFWGVDSSRQYLVAQAGVIYSFKKVDGSLLSNSFFKSENALNAKADDVHLTSSPP